MRAWERESENSMPEHPIFPAHYLAVETGQEKPEQITQIFTSINSRTCSINLVKSKKERLNQTMFKDNSNYGRLKDREAQVLEFSDLLSRAPNMNVSFF